MEKPPDSPFPRRRARYSGTHPRRFSEKYKELAPAEFPEEAAKVIARGMTPAGTHRSVMAREVLEVLRPRPGEIAVDCTLGGAGHAAEILRAILPSGFLIAIDADPAAIPRAEERLRAEGFPPERFFLRRTNFAGLPRVFKEERLRETGIAGADVILADLGLSSMQLDDPARGFTFKDDGPLDLRFNTDHGRPGSEALASLSEKELARLLAEHADEPEADRIARAVAQSRSSAPIVTTRGLAEAVRSAFPRARGSIERERVGAAIRRTFQALRILVNDEFSALDALLEALPACLRPGGRAAVISFHSGEDRRVKHSFRDGLRLGLYAAISEKVIRPTAEEVRSNPRAAPAKLRWARVPSPKSQERLAISLTRTPPFPRPAAAPPGTSRRGA